MIVLRVHSCPADQQMVNELFVAVPNVSVEYGTPVHRVLKVRVGSHEHELPRCIFVAAHGWLRCSPQSRPRRGDRHHVHFLQGSCLKQRRNHADVFTESYCAKQGATTAAPPPRTPVRPSSKKGVEEIQIASGGGMLQRHPETFRPLLWGRNERYQFEYLALEPLQGNALGIDVHRGDSVLA